MTDYKKVERVLRNHKGQITREFKLKEIGLFGSLIRGEHNKKSDIDILVDFNETPGLLKYIAMERYLSKLLGKKVDLVMKSALKPRIGKHILEEVIYI